MILACVACKSERVEVLQEIGIGDMRVAVEKTGDITARVVVYQNGKSSDVYEIGNIDFDMDCFLEKNNHDEILLGKELLRLSYQESPTEKDIHNRSEMDILFDINEAGVIPVVIAKDTFYTGDYDNDGVIEVMTNYDAGGIPRVMVYDNIDGKILCANPEESMVQLYEISSRGANIPKEIDSEGWLEIKGGFFESNNYAGVNILFADLNFKEMSIEDLRKMILEGKAVEYEKTSEISHPKRDILGAKTLEGYAFVNFKVDPPRGMKYGSEEELAIPYKIEVNDKGEIESATADESFRTVWGRGRWDKIETEEKMSETAKLMRIYEYHELHNGWNVTISEDRKSVVFDGWIRIGVELDPEVTNNRVRERSFAKYEIEVLVP